MYYSINVQPSCSPGEGTLFEISLFKLLRRGRWLQGVLEQSLTEVYLRSGGQWCKVYLECYRSVGAEGCSLSTGRGRKGSWISSVLHTGVYQGEVYHGGVFQGGVCTMYKCTAYQRSGEGQFLLILGGSQKLSSATMCS